MRSSLPHFALFTLSTLTSGKELSIIKPTAVTTRSQRYSEGYPASRDYERDTVSTTRVTAASVTKGKQAKLPKGYKNNYGQGSARYHEEFRRDQSIAGNDLFSQGGSSITTTLSDSSQGTITVATTSEPTLSSSIQQSGSSSVSSTSTSSPAAPLVTGQTTALLFNINTASNESYSQVTYMGKLLSVDGPNTIYGIDCYLTANTSICAEPVTITQGKSMFIRADATSTTSLGGVAAAKQQATGAVAGPSSTADGGFLSCSLAPDPTGAVCVERILLPTPSVSAKPALFGEGLNKTILMTSTFAPSLVVSDMLVVTSGIEIIVGNTTTSSTSFESTSSAYRTPVGPTAVSPESIQTMPATTVGVQGNASAQRSKLVWVVAIGIMCSLALTLI